jgi:UDP-N-acetylglucosamine 3-dehydrogenase
MVSPQRNGRHARLRVGLIGLGLMGRNHLRVLSELEDVDLVAVSDSSEAALARVRRSHDMNTYLDYQTMLEREHLDAVSVVVPTREHRRVALDVLDRKVSLLVEKPLAMTSAEGREILDRAAQTGTLLAVGHIERFNPAVVALHRQLTDGALGRLFEIKARRTGPFPDRIKDVGVVIDLATHDIDLMLKLTGAQVQRVACETTRNVHTMFEDMLLGVLRFSNGAIGSLDVNWLSPTKTRDLTLIGERGMFTVDYLTQQLYLYENGTANDGWDHLSRLSGVSEGRMIRLIVDRTEPLRAELSSFVRSVRDGTAPEVTGADGLAALEVAEALLRSSEAGCDPVVVNRPVEMVAGR